MRTLIRTSAIIALTASLSACVSGAQSVNMVPTSLQQVDTGNPLSSSVSVEGVTGGKETSPLWTSQISNAQFHGALRDALTSAGLYEPIGDYTLEARLISVDQPFAGLDLTVTTTVEYILRRSNGLEVFRDTISTPYTATFSDAVIASTRLRLANEGSARANISRMIDQLQSEGNKLRSTSVTS